MPWHHGWNVLAVGLLYQAVSFGLGIYCFTFWIEPWAGEFDVGRGTVMQVFITLQVTMGVLAPFAGRAMDRLPIRGLVLAGTCCLALAMWCCARATMFWQLMVVYGTLMVGGLLLAGPLAAQTLAARWFADRRGLALGISSVGTSIGGLVMPPVLTGLQAAHGWREANDLLAAGVLVLLLPVWLVVRSPPVVAPGPDDAGAAMDPSMSTVDILSSGRFWLLVLAFVPVTTAFGGVQQNLAPYASDHGIDAQAVAVLVATMALIMIAAKLVFGAMADRWDVRLPFWVTLIALGGTFALMSGPLSYGELAVICAGLGIAAGGFLPLLGSAVSTRFGVAAFGRVMGMLGPFMTLGALGPWLAGYLRDSTGSYDLAWLLLAALLVPAAVSISLLRPGRRSAQSPSLP